MVAYQRSSASAKERPGYEPGDVAGSMAGWGTQCSPGKLNPNPQFPSEFASNFMGRRTGEQEICDLASCIYGLQAQSENLSLCRAQFQPLQTSSKCRAWECEGDPTNIQRRIVDALDQIFNDPTLRIALLGSMMDTLRLLSEHVHESLGNSL